MRHFDQLPATEIDRLFQHAPQQFDAATVDLGFYLGAALYSSGTRPRMAEVLVRQRARGVAAMVLDLEDAVADDAVVHAEEMIVAALVSAHVESAAIPLTFIRVRAVEQVGDLIRRLGPAAAAVSGFVLPKFDQPSSLAALEEVADVAQRSGTPLLAMPVLEGPAVAYRESRATALADAARFIDKHSGIVPVVRIGGTDISGTFGVRRPAELTVYDLVVVRDAISDIVNTFARPGMTGVISGCVFEYFTPTPRVLKPQLRATPFPAGQHGQEVRSALVATDSDALITEVVMDKANGLVGKTVIHPSHTAVVHSLFAVTAEEFDDAESILVDENAGGVKSSGYGNKMNELRPHRIWAQRVQTRARAFGVLKEDVSFADLLVSQADHQP